MQTTPRSLVVLVLLLAASLAGAGCMQTSSPSPTNVSVGTGSPPAQVSADLQRLVESEIRTTGVAGIQIGVATREWSWNSAAGNASEITGEPAEPGMRFLIASVSKTFTSVAVQRLAEDGRLSLDDSIDRWLPADLVERIPNGHRITVRQLLDHTSGIADYDESAINLQELENPDVPVPYQVGLGMGLNASPLYAPGAGYTYSNVNYILLTLIVDSAAGIPYEDYATRTILVPTGMNDTFFQHTNRIPGPHMKAQIRDDDGTIRDFADLYVLFDRGAGDLVSTTADLNRFHRALREGRLIGRASLAEMEKGTPQSGTGGYGLGYATEFIAPPNVTVQGHTGGYPGSFTFWYYLPDTDTYVTFNLNSLGSPAATENLTAIRAAIVTYLKNGSAGGSSPRRG